MNSFHSDIMISISPIQVSIRIQKSVFILVLFLSTIGLFMLFNPRVYPHFQTQLLGNRYILHSIDTIFESNYYSTIPTSFRNSTNKRVPHGNLLRQMIFSKFGSKYPGPKRHSHLDPTFVVHPEASIPSPYVLLSNRSRKQVFLEKLRINPVNRDTKLIGFSNRPTWLQNDLTFDRCQITNCRMVGTLALHHAHAVVFSAPDLPLSDPPPRPRGQRWVYYNLESPHHTNNVTSSRKWRRQFNFTMTYRRDSDIFLPYAFFERRIKPLHKDYERIVRGKTKLVAVFISNCESSSRRLDYVRLLQKYIPIDVYGKCGPFSCYSKDHWHCLDVVDAEYKFYLSFENSYCVDYVTEKFTKTFRHISVIPIVRGGADYDQILPNDTFINTAWFATPLELANFITELNRDDRRYIKFLRRKDQYVEANHLPFQRAFCDLCHRLHWDESVQYYNDVSKWYSQDACHEPTDVND